jgi:hypothetical protein
MAYNGVLNMVDATVYSMAAFEGDKTFQATVVGTGALTATVTIKGSNDGVNFVTIGTITLSGTTSATDGFASSGMWAYHQAVSSGVTGTGAIVTVLMGS